MLSPFLIGTTIYLRAFERADAPLLAQYINDPDVTLTLKVYRPMNTQREEEFIENTSKGEHDLALGIALKSTDQLIGAVGFHGIDFKDRKADFGIMIAVKEEWNKGHGTEATKLMIAYGFETLNLHRIELRVYENNPRAIRVYEKVGFKREGTLRQEHYRQGRYWDTHVMAILRDEWRK